MINFTEEGLIEQPERLFTVRPRSAAQSPTEWGGAGNRGTRARFRLLTPDIDKTQRDRRVRAVDKNGNVTNEGFSSANAKDYIVSRLLNTSPGAGYASFLLTNVSVTMNEKVQITQTFGDAETVYYFGKAPIIFNLSGMLIDDLDNQWFTMFVEMYTHILRGTELARNYELAELILPNMVVIGSVMTFSYQQDASRDTDIPFTMQFHAKELRPIPVQIPAFPSNPEAAVINFNKAQGYKDFTTVTQVNSLKSRIDKLKGVAQNPLGKLSDIEGINRSLGSTADKIMSGSSSMFNNTNFGGLGETLQEVSRTGGEVGKSIDPIALEDLVAQGKFSAVDSDYDYEAPSKGATLNSGPQSPTTGSSTTSLSSFRSSLFSPVFGVLTSITKVVKTVTGDISQIISSFTNPVNTVLREIQGISTQAVAVVKLIENSINTIVNIPVQIRNEIRNTIVSLRNAAGVISRAPETIAQSVKRMTRFGNLKTSAAFLTSGGKKPTGKIALLSSGKLYSAASGSSVR